MNCNQRPQSRSRIWEGVCHISGNKLTLSEIDEHNSPAEGESYHKFLRKIYSKVRGDYSSIGKEYALQIFVKATTGMAGPDELVPTLLVFDTSRRFPDPLKSDLRSQKKRLEAVDDSRKKFANLNAKQPVDSAQKPNRSAAESKFPDAALEQDLLMYRDASVGKGVGPFLVRDFLGKHVVVDLNGNWSKFSNTPI